MQTAVVDEEQGLRFIDPEFLSEAARVDVLEAPFHSFFHTFLMWEDHVK